MADNNWRQSIVLVTVDNDAEARTILRIGTCAGMAIVRSAQGHGAKLHLEPELFARIAATGRTTVWTVELPGPDVEKLLREQGYTVVIIDHHTYGDLHRTHHPLTGMRLKSSLEQFLALAEITNDELAAWGFNPRVVLGLGVFDDRFARGLRAEGFTLEEIRAVLDERDSLLACINAHHAAARNAARAAWRARVESGPFTVVVSRSPVPVNAEVGMITIHEGVEDVPLVVSHRDAAELFVQNVEPTLIAKLTATFSLGDTTFTFGMDKCWGVNNVRRPPDAVVSLKDIMHNVIVHYDPRMLADL